MSDRHDVLRDDLKAYSDRELPLLGRMAVRGHLARCAACREELNAMEQTAHDLRAAEPSGPLSDALRAKLLAAGTGAAPAAVVAPPAPPFVLPSLWRRQPLLVFGVSGAVLAVSLLLFVPTFMATKSALPPTAPSTSTALRTSSEASRAAAPEVAKVATNGMANRYDKSAGLNYPAEAYPRGSAPLNERQAQAAAAPPPPAALRIAREPDVAAGPGAAKSQFEYRRLDSADRLTARRAAVGAATPPPPARARPSAPVASVAVAQALAERKIHRTASIGIAVEADQIEAKSDAVEAAVQAVGGYVASNDLDTGENGYRSATLDVRVPIDQFDPMMTKFARMGKVVSKSVTGEDVTEKTSDVQSAEQVLVSEVTTAQARLRRMVASEKRVGQKEQELRQLKIQLAQTRARLGLLRRMAALSAITVQISEKPKAALKKPADNGSGFWAGMRDTNRAAGAAFQTAVRVPLVLVVWVLAFSPIWAPLSVVYRWAAARSSNAGAPAVAKPVD